MINYTAGSMESLKDKATSSPLGFLQARSTQICLASQNFKPYDIPPSLHAPETIHYMATSKDSYGYQVGTCIIEGYKKGNILTSTQALEAEDYCEAPPPSYELEPHPVAQAQPVAQAEPVAQAQPVVQTESVTQAQPVARNWVQPVVEWSKRTMATPASDSNCPPLHVAKKAVILGSSAAVGLGTLGVECVLSVGCCCGLDCTVCHCERSTDPLEPKNLVVQCLCNPNKC
jgi:hypothetical protein